MKPIKLKLAIFIFPAFVVAWGIFNLCFFDPFFAKSSDPEFPYLVNGLNCALLKFNYIGHIDHPGTPFQVFNGIVIRITHLLSGKGDIARDVFARPEHYLNWISAFLILLQAMLVFAVGWIGAKRKIPFGQIALLQAGFLFNDILWWLFYRVNPDRFFMISGMLFILVYLKHGHENRSPQKFALWSGVVMALGLATKFNFLPVLLLPLLLIDTNRNRMIYIGSGIVSFFVFIAPIITKLDEYFRFLTGIFNHDGLYGSGESKVLNLGKMMESIIDIFRQNPELFILIISLIILLVVALWRKDKFSILFAGFLVIIVMQIVMVSKHFKNYYLAPTFVIYGFMFLIISLFLSEIVKKKSQLTIACSLLPFLFVISTAVKIKRDFPIIAELKAQRDKIRNFVDTSISKDDYLFIEPTWEAGPFKENAIVYGLSYCGHRDKYLPQLMTVNPNVITFEGDKNPVKLWRGAPVSLDRITATGKNIYIHSSAGRNAPVLIQMLKDAALRNQFQLAIDTVFSDRETKNKIIRVKTTNSKSGWTPGKVIPGDRQSKINSYVETIKNTPDWLDKVRKKAIARNIPLDSMILLDATWMTDSEN